MVACDRCRASPHPSPPSKPRACSRRSPTRVPAEILRGAAERFPGRIVLTCSWQRTSSVLVHLIAIAGARRAHRRGRHGSAVPRDARGARPSDRAPRHHRRDAAASAHGRRAGRRSGLRAVAARARRVLRPAQGRAARARARGRRRLGLRRSAGRRGGERATVQPFSFDEKRGVVRSHRSGSGAPRTSTPTAPQHDLPVHALHAQGYPSIGCMPVHARRSLPARTSAPDAGPGRRRPSAVFTGPPQPDARRPSTLPRCCVCTLGDLLLDVVVRLGAPLEPGSDAPARTSLSTGGQAANVAAWAVALGAEARLVCRRGTGGGGVPRRGGSAGARRRDRRAAVGGGGRGRRLARRRRAATGRWRPTAAPRPACARPTSIRPGSTAPPRCTCRATRCCASRSRRRAPRRACSRVRPAPGSRSISPPRR